MKRLSHILTGLFVCLAALFFTWSILPSASSGNAASTGPRSTQMSSPNYVMDWNVVGSASGGVAASANYKLNGTVGQIAASDGDASSNYATCSGFQCVLNALHTYLPILKR